MSNSLGSRPEGGAIGDELERWTGMLSAASGAIALREPLSVVETESGLTAAIARPYDLPIKRHGIRNTYGTSLIAMSVLRSGALTFEEHSSDINGRYLLPPDRFDQCDTQCTRRVITGDRVTDFPFDAQFSIDSFSVPSLLEPSALLREYMARARHADAATQDVFREGGRTAMALAKTVLERHQLLSPAANEAFGLPSMRAIGTK